ncbi:MAG: gliding motility-associated C-terminal domain-containing protein [Bacteroidota bacterium]
MRRTLIILLFCVGEIASAQMNVVIQSQVNYVCNGADCFYEGPSILINEVMLAPISGDGSIYGSTATLSGGGEWIELYNPNLCKPVDISCYYLGNNTNDGSTYGGGYRIPDNTIVPAGGFVVIRGINAEPVPSNLLVQNGGKTLELVVDNNLNNVCLDGGIRLWFPNTGGWFAFYDANGVPQDAISWNSLTNSCMSCPPCIPTSASCSNAVSLLSYNDILSTCKNYICSIDPINYQGLSWRRIPDGAAWASNAVSNTIGNCNGACNPEPLVTCDGVAQATVSGGTPPFSYLWSDSKGSLTSFANGLCEGNYCVTVTDANNLSVIQCVDIFNFKPQLSFNGSNFYFLDNGPVNVSSEFKPNGGILSGNGIVNNVFDPSLAGVGLHTISYVYEDVNTCSDSINIDIKVIERSKLIVPNVFTPNSDGANDLFKVKCTSIADFHCDIFNRWGKKIYNWDNFNEGWNGETDGGVLANEGTYYYIITATGTDKVLYNKSGTVTLIR